MKSSSEVEEKSQSWFQGLFEFTERERVVRSHSSAFHQKRASSICIGQDFSVQLFGG